MKTKTISNEYTYFCCRCNAPTDNEGNVLKAKDYENWENTLFHKYQTRQGTCCFHTPTDDNIYTRKLKQNENN